MLLGWELEDVHSFTCTGCDLENFLKLQQKNLNRTVNIKRIRKLSVNVVHLKSAAVIVTVSRTWPTKSKGGH